MKRSHLAIFLLNSHGYMATPNAAERVCGISELLENILLHLGNGTPAMKQLFVMQRINSSFRDIVNTSKKLRRIVYLEKGEGVEGRANPLCLDGDFYDWSTLLCPFSFSQKDPWPANLQQGFCHPIRPLRYYGLYIPPSSQEKCHILHFDMSRMLIPYLMLMPSLKTLPMNLGGSWLHMQIANDSRPVSVHVFARHHRFLYQEESLTADLGSGATFGKLMDFVMIDVILRKTPSPEGLRACTRVLRADDIEKLDEQAVADGLDERPPEDPSLRLKRLIKSFRG